VGNDFDNQFPVLASGQGPSIVVGGTFQGLTDIEQGATPSGFDPLAVAFCP
jgi:hypothetical protein